MAGIAGRYCCVTHTYVYNQCNGIVVTPMITWLSYLLVDNDQLLNCISEHCNYALTHFKFNVNNPVTPSAFR